MEEMLGIGKVGQIVAVSPKWQMTANKIGDFTKVVLLILKHLQKLQWSKWWKRENEGK
jgi:hypothetical protein